MNDQSNHETPAFSITLVKLEKGWRATGLGIEVKADYAGVAVAEWNGELMEKGGEEYVLQNARLAEEREIESLRSLVAELAEALKKTTSVYRHPEINEDALIRRAEAAADYDR